MKINASRLPIYTLLAIVGIWFLYPLALLWGADKGYISKSLWEPSGVFGDSFGALNTLFSGLALTAVAVNIVIQTKQLKKLRRKEQQTASLLDTQVLLAAMTAALNSYNHDADLYQRIGQSIAGNDAIHDASRLMAVQKHGEVMAKRNALLQEVEAMISQSRGRATAQSTPSNVA